MAAEILPIGGNTVGRAGFSATWTLNADTANAVTVTFTSSGPEIAWGTADPAATIVVAHALLDGARAVRAGDDPTEVAQAEWLRRLTRR